MQLNARPSERTLRGVRLQQIIISSLVPYCVQLIVIISKVNTEGIISAYSQAQSGAERRHGPTRALTRLATCNFPR